MFMHENISSQLVFTVLLQLKYIYLTYCYFPPILYQKGGRRGGAEAVLKCMVLGNASHFQIKTLKLFIRSRPALFERRKEVIIIIIMNNFSIALFPVKNELNALNSKMYNR